MSEKVMENDNKFLSCDTWVSKTERIIIGSLGVSILAEKQMSKVHWTDIRCIPWNVCDVMWKVYRFEIGSIL